MEETHQSPSPNQNPNVKLKRGVRGDYGWDIFVSAEDMEKVLKEIEITNNELISKYGKGV